MIDREALELECQVRCTEAAQKHGPNDTPTDVFSDGFWQGVRAAAKPRSVATLRRILERHAAKGRIEVAA